MSEFIELHGERIAVGEKIGVGATGVVHAGVMADGRRVAIKIVHAQYCNSSEAVSRYAREVTALSKLTHANSVRLYGHGEMDDGRVFIVMELLEGETLNLLVNREAPLSIDRILPMFIDVCGAVVEAHRTGLVHRDIKPENIFVVRRDGKESLKLMDFGFVRFSENSLAAEHTALTTMGSVLGTPGFMSPEQARGQQADERSDVYALAVTLYECLCGKVPFEGSGQLQIMVSQSTKPPVALDKRVKGLVFEPKLVDAIMHALASDVNARTASVEAFVAELKLASTAKFTSATRDASAVVGIVAEPPPRVPNAPVATHASEGNGIRKVALFVAITFAVIVVVAFFLLRNGAP